MRFQAVLTICMTLTSFSAIASDVPVPEVGSAAPRLKLPAADGTSRSLEAADETMVLVFYRGLW
jgi:hypothetical protein